MRRQLWVALVAVALLVAGCTHEQARQEASRPAASPAAALSTPTASPRPSPTPVPTVVPTSPLTGEGTRSSASVVVVKVDNGILARRYHRGLGDAAIVYQELVEGGATRFAAVYDRDLRAEVGPVRSARGSDFELIRQLGPVALAFSGANPGTLREFDREVRAGRALDASYDAAPQIYRLGERRADARNFFTTPDSIRRAQPKTAPARDIGLRFGPLGARGAPATSARIRFSKFSLVTVAFDARTGTYQVQQDGHPMAGVQPANVVVQRVQIRKTKYRDVLGLPTPYTVTVGQGSATVLRDGVRIDGGWRRPSPDGGTRLVDAGGSDIPLRPGATWIMLVPAGQPLTTS